VPCRAAPLPPLAHVSRSGAHALYTVLVVGPGILAGSIGYGVLSHELMYYVAAAKAWQLPAALTVATKFTLGFPISFHVFNGIRHLVRACKRETENGNERSC
jgi:succinate dehydrogenase/fumarate reductase cytochrome b subunit